MVSRENRTPELLTSVSPVTYLSKDDPPVLIFHGDKDLLVPLSRSEYLRKRYQQAGLQSSLHVIEGAGLRCPVATLAQSVGICGIAHALRERGYGRMRTFQTGRDILRALDTVVPSSVVPPATNRSRSSSPGT